MLPLVSVIIPLYNRENTIQRAIDSVLNQTYTNIEILVVDDGSTDKSVQMLDKYRDDERVKVFCQETNKGANAARNRGIRESVGEYIAFHDSDDEWLPDKLEKQLRTMKTENCHVSFCSFKRHYDNAVQIVPNISEKLSSEDIRQKLKRGNIIGTPTLVLHKDVIARVGMFDEEMPRLQDYEYAIRLVRRYDICFVNEVLVNEYQLSGCISLNAHGLNKAYGLLLKKHSDFLDIDYIWNQYLETGNLWEEHETDWVELDKVIRNITDDNVSCSADRLYKSTIKALMDRYLRLKTYERHRFDNLLKQLANRRFIVYGAGYFARQLAEHLRQAQLMPAAFVVTQKDGTDSIDGIPVKTLTEWQDKEIIVIVAVSGTAQKKIIENLDKAGMTDYYIYPECI